MEDALLHKLHLEQQRLKKKEENLQHTERELNETKLNVIKKENEMQYQNQCRGKLVREK